MSETTGRFEWVLRAARLALVCTLTVFALSAVVAVALTIALAAQELEWKAFAGWMVVLLVGELVVAAWVVAAYGLLHVATAMEASVSAAAGRIGNIETLLEDQAKSARKIADLEALSDQAKSLLFREREIEALRETIHDDLMRQNYQAAEAMIDSFEKKFGYAEEAAKLRQEVENSRKATLDEKLDAAINRIQSIMDRQDWPRALREAQRVLRLFPDNPKVKALPQRIEAARNKQKRLLLEAYGEAVRKNDIDRGVELLRDLDRYLTPQEAAALEESARGVFKARLHQLGVQFAIRVTDQQWKDAIAVGEQIIREFPNSRMANEVRQSMDLLHSRAEAIAAARQ